VAPALRRLIWGALLYTYVVIYLGAFVRHTSASLACGVDWPLCNGALLPAAYGPMIAQFAHRLAAAGAVVLLAVLWITARRTRTERPDLYRGSLIALAAVVLQALSGASVILSRLDVFATLLHGVLVSVMFGCLSYLALHTLRRPGAARVPASRPRVLAASR
jgi:cytochrome c oxidase assembly protein subunit 15